MQSAQQQFDAKVRAAQELLLASMGEVASRINGTPSTLLPRLFCDGCQQYIKEAFFQFLAIGEQFPSEIKMGSAIWARLLQPRQSKTVFQAHRLSCACGNYYPFCNEKQLGRSCKNQELLMQATRWKRVQMNRRNRNLRVRQRQRWKIQNSSNVVKWMERTKYPTA